MSLRWVFIHWQLFRFDNFRDAISHMLSDRDRFIRSITIFYFTLALLTRRLCSQSGSSRDPSPTDCVTPTVTVRSTTMVVRVSGSRKPLFKFANYLMTGHPNKASAIFNRPAGFRSHLRSNRIGERNVSRAQTMSSHFDCVVRRLHFFAATMRTSIKKKVEQV